MNITINGHTPWRLFIGPHETRIVNLSFEDQNLVSNLDATLRIPPPDGHGYNVVTIRNHAGFIIWTGKLLHESVGGAFLVILAEGAWGAERRANAIHYITEEILKLEDKNE